MLTIEVLGQPFTFRTDTDVSEAKAVADYVIRAVDKVTSEFTKRVPKPDKGAILILAALNITSEFLDLQKEHQKLLQDIAQRSSSLLNALETQHI